MGERRKKVSKRKVSTACIFCRRSHMTCDDGRPCKRCIKRDIGHLCHDETTRRAGEGTAARRSSVNSTASASPSNRASANVGSTSTPENLPSSQPLAPSAIVDVLGGGSSTAGRDPMLGAMPAMQQNQQQPPIPTMRLPMQPDMMSNLMSAPSPSWAASMLGGASFLGLGGGNPVGAGTEFAASGDAAGGNEYSILSEFLESLDGTSALPTPAAGITGTESNTAGQPMSIDQNGLTADGSLNTDLGAGVQATQALARNRDRRYSIADTTGLAGSKTENFFLTAADQKDGTRDERLGKVIQAKLDAGLLRPYNHVKGYARLNHWMEQNCSQASRRRILKPLSIFRPAFRAVAQRLTNVDLIFIEEAFERLLLDYDRVFSTQGIPACLWRRTGEIYKGNKEFADLVGVDFDALREGRCTIYELMQEESAVNYWEKYGAVCFDPGQKAVLTSCVLKTNNHKKRNGGSSAPRSGMATPAAIAESRQTGDATKKAAPKGQSASAKKGARTDAASANANGNAEVRAVNGKGDLPAQEDGYLSCCFSFTIRRDAWGIPYAIVGNFLPLDR